MKHSHSHHRRLRQVVTDQADVSAEREVTYGAF